jgi:hypothetical protein
VRLPELAAAVSARAQLEAVVDWSGQIRNFDVQDEMVGRVEEYLARGMQHLSGREAASLLGVCKRTVERYRALAKRAGLL